MSVDIVIKNIFKNFFRFPHPVIGSFAAAAVALLPILVMAFTEIYSYSFDVVTSKNTDDAGGRSAIIILAVAPLIYVILVIICYAFGTFLISLGIIGFRRFIGATTLVLLIISISLGLFLSHSRQFGLGDAIWSVSISGILSFTIGLPAAFSWWFFVPRVLLIKN